jgi:hypothetical protein
MPTGQPLIIYCALVKYLRKKWEYNEAVHQLFIDFKKACDSIRREVMDNILTDSGIPMKLVMLIQMCLNETYSTVRIGKHLSDIFPIKNCLKQEYPLTPLFFNFALEYANRRVQVYQDGLKLNGTHQVLVYANDVNILDGSLHTIKKNTEAFVVASEETELQVNAHKTKYMVLSNQNAGRSHNIKIDNSYFEREP